tara:strand:+ start:16023 stop:16568 length:546 start_codon:yes stop_codon:yes gene_type:complete
MNNKYVIELNASVDATADTDPATGINATSKRWGDNNTITSVLSDGRTLVANDRLVYDGDIVDKLTDTSISKIVSLRLQPNSISNIQNTGIKIPLSRLEFSSNIEVLGISFLGYKSGVNGLEKYHLIQEVKTVTGANAGEVASDFLRFVVDGNDLMVFVTKNYFSQIVRESTVTMNIIIHYR